jgi:tRNA (guanine-N7-)-methyltransferase
MGKDKLKRFRENLSFTNLIQPKIIFPPQDHELKGNWKKNFFKNENPIILELGCGRGEYAVNMALMFPGKNFIGVDWKGARLWRGAKTAFEDQIMNVGFLRIQIQNIYAFFAKEEVDEIWITFPDPKLLKSDENKRLTSKRFLNIYRQFMNADGIVNLKSDSKAFYDYTLEIISEENLNILNSDDDIYSKTDIDKLLTIQTTYEKLWLKQGSKICYLKFRLNP